MQKEMSTFMNPDKIQDRVRALRDVMERRHIDAYYVGTADPHNSEYVAPHFQARAWLTGFSGSAGTAVVTRDRALLWTDGRYHIQAEKQLAGTPFELMKQGMPGVPTVGAWMAEMLPAGACVALDGRLIPDAAATRMERQLGAKGIRVAFDLDAVDMIWDDRPDLPKGEIFIHDLRYAGRTASDKIADVRRNMVADGADYALYVGLDDIAWLMNFRGSDIPFNPVVLAFALITRDEAVLFIDEDKVGGVARTYFSEQGITIAPYDALAARLAALSPGVLVADRNRVSRAMIAALPETVTVLAKQDYPSLMKAVLNKVELRSMYRAGVRDSVAVTRFMHFMKCHAVDRGMNEYDVTHVLHDLRATSDMFFTESFSTISAYGPNAAMMHYQATREQHADLKAEGLYLVDCGAQTLDGTTDITRTFALGPITDRARRDYTLTLKSHIALASLIFLRGANGTTLDAVARTVMWRERMDYKCGTGHGFGFVAGVHEGPQRLTHHPSFGAYGFREHNVITIEPGVYREGEHGIRLENDYVVVGVDDALSVNHDTNEVILDEHPPVPDVMGDIYVKFFPLTFVPFDRDAIDVAMLTDDEIAWLNDYNRAIRREVCPYLTGDVLAFTMAMTEPF